MPFDHESLIPEKYKHLSGSMLKVIAVVTMLIDHTAKVLGVGADVVLFRVSGIPWTLSEAMNLIGRLAFPIFAFLLVEGFCYTKDRRMYGVRLFLFALISEIPWNLEHTGRFLYSSQNVFFTLLLGFLGLCALERFLKTEGKDRLLSAGMLFVLVVISFFLKADYGMTGFGFILVMYFLRKAPFFRAIVGSCILSSTWRAGLAFIPIAFYNGKRGFIKGRVLQILFYAIYPVHMLILFWIRSTTIGY